MQRRPWFTLLIFGALAGALLVAAGLAAARTEPQTLQEQKLAALDGVADDQFGSDVAYSNGVSVVGAPHREVGAVENQGAVYIFGHSGELDLQEQITADDGAKWDEFGAAVAVEGDTIVATAPYHAVGGNTSQGAAYVFTRSAGVWTQQAELTASDGLADDQFGQYSAAISGDTIAIGAPYKNVDGSFNQGAVYVFTGSGDTWTEQARITLPDGVEDDWFGAMVALDGDTLLIGCMERNHSVGASYVYVRSGDTWTQQAELTSGSTTADYFGWSNALDGDTAVVGSYGANDMIGGAYVFTRSNGVWSAPVELTAPDLVADSEFGAGVGVDGDTVVVTAQEQLLDGKLGAAYVYTRTGTTWSDPVRLQASDGGSVDDFGWAARIEDNTILIGAPFAGGTGHEYQGAAYLFTPTVGPSADVTGAPTGWQKRPVTLTFSATPSEGGAPVATTQYWGGAVEWVDAASLVVSAQGATAVQYRAVDVNGTAGPEKSRIVRIDSKRPRVVAKAASGAAGSTVRLAYTVSDFKPGCGSATVKVLVKNASGRVLARSTVRRVSTNKRHTLKISTRGAAAGSYRVELRATDLAGNAQKRPTVVRMSIR
jgi:hypothetical protein